VNKSTFCCKIFLLEKHGCYTLQEVKPFSSFKSINSICSSYKVVMSILKIKPLFIWVRFTIFYEFLSIKVVVAYLSKIFFFVLKVNKSYRCWTHKGEQWQHLWVNYPFKSLLNTHLANTFKTMIINRVWTLACVLVCDKFRVWAYICIQWAYITKCIFCEGMELINLTPT